MYDLVAKYQKKNPLKTFDELNDALHVAYQASKRGLIGVDVLFVNSSGHTVSMITGDRLNKKEKEEIYNVETSN